MGVTIPDDVLHAAHMNEAELRQELALVLFEQERLTLGQAARLTGLGVARFQHLVASRGIELHYGIEELEADLGTLHELGRL